VKIRNFHSRPVKFLTAAGFASKFYYANKEKPPFNTGQDYRAHLPYTSLRLSFGGREWEEVDISR
jgi:hypothetical protein